jgi:hypothetical protein
VDTVREVYHGNAGWSGAVTVLAKRGYRRTLRQTSTVFGNLKFLKYIVSIAALLACIGDVGAVLILVLLSLVGHTEITTAGWCVMALVNLTKVTEELTAEKLQEEKQPNYDSDEDELVPVSEDERKYLHSSSSVVARTRTRRQAAIRADVAIRQEIAKGNEQSGKRLLKRTSSRCI